MTVRVPYRARDAVIDMLAVELPAMLDGHEGLQVRATVPAGWQPPDGPLVIVEHDGTTGPDWPVATRDTIRITTYAAQPDGALCLLALGACLDRPIRGVDRAKAGVWPIDATDSITGAHLTSATVILTARTEEKGL